MNTMRTIIQNMKESVKRLVDPTHQDACRKAGHYLRFLDQQLEECDRTEAAIDTLMEPFPQHRFEPKYFPGMFDKDKGK